MNGKSDGSALRRRADAGDGRAGRRGAPSRCPAAALVIGLGTGSTAGWLAQVPSIERVDVVELEPAVAEVARLCALVNRDCLGNPRIHLHVGDGRELLLTSRQQYDIVFSEPSNPYRVGVSSLFTTRVLSRRPRGAWRPAACSCSGCRATKSMPRPSAPRTRRWQRSSRR